MVNIDKILELIKVSIHETAPNAIVILYGSQARGEGTDSSDIDLLILIDSPSLTREEEKNILYSLYDIEIENGILISPLILSKTEWHDKHSITPFYENVTKEGVLL